VAGLAVNRALGHGKAKEQLEFVGNTLFIPMFFVSIGFLIKLDVFAETLVDGIGLVVGIVGGLVGAKFLAARLTQRIYAYTGSEGRLIWSLSLPQVAATLAPALVAYETKNAEGIRLIDEAVLNTMLVLVVITSTLGPMLTEYFGRQRVAEQEASARAAALRPPAEVRAPGGVSDPAPPNSVRTSAKQAEPGAPADLPGD